MKSASEYWKERFGEEPKSDNDKLMCAMMREYAEHYQEEMQQALSLGAVSGSLPPIDPLDDENSEIYKIGREIAEMSGEELEANCNAFEKVINKSRVNDR